MRSADGASEASRPRFDTKPVSSITVSRAAARILRARRFLAGGSPSPQEPPLGCRSERVQSHRNAYAGSWLCPTEPDRARLLDMTRRLLPAGVLLAITCGPIIVLIETRIGPIVIAPYLLAAATVVALGTVVPSRARPEYWFFAGDVVTMTAMACVIALSGGGQSPVLALMAWPLIAVAGRHTQRGLVLFTILLVGTTALACALAINQAVDYGSLRFAGFVTVIVGLTIVVLALTRAEREAREQSLVDPLTGTLNRLALRRRLEELRAQASVDHGGLCVVATDIDLFKQINDTHGHEIGDLVLRDVAHALRTNLRAFPLLYRIGGEEFVAVLPGLAAQEGKQIAERLRTAIEKLRPRGISVTASFGVAASVADPDAAFTIADRCLYQAKAAGRNCVVGPGGGDGQAPEGRGIERRAWHGLPRSAGGAWA